MTRHVNDAATVRTEDGRGRRPVIERLALDSINDSERFFATLSKVPEPAAVRAEIWRTDGNAIILRPFLTVSDNQRLFALLGNVGHPTSVRAKYDLLLDAGLSEWISRN